MTVEAITINSVSKIAATAEAGVYWITNNFSIGGFTSNGVYGSRPEDNSPHNQLLRQWMADHPEFTVTPYEPPVVDPRAMMPTLTARQFRLGLLAGGRTPAQVTATIEAMPEGATKETAKIEWEYATTFKRTHPLIATVGTALGLTPEAIDDMWLASVNL